MVGAIIGDVAGSKYEFNNIKSKNFKLLDKDCYFTDDTVMTLAIAEILQRNEQNDKDKIIDTLKKWGRAFPNAGYGSRFYDWLFSDNREPYNSCGNGSAMRISPVGWYATSEKEVKDFSRKLTQVTHNHKEGLKGAEVTAMCVYYARIGKSKEFIKEYVEQYYSLDFDYDELVKTYYHGAEICQNTVPEAIYCFLISNSYEDCIKTTISIGGDCDTTSAISGAIAEAYYKNKNGVSRKLIKKLTNFLPKEEINGCNVFEVLTRYTSRYSYLANLSHYNSCSVDSYHINLDKEERDLLTDNGYVYKDGGYYKKLDIDYYSDLGKAIKGFLNDEEFLKNNLSNPELVDFITSNKIKFSFGLDSNGKNRLFLIENEDLKKISNQWYICIDEMFRNVEIEYKGNFIYPLFVYESEKLDKYALNEMKKLKELVLVTHKNIEVRD